MSLLSLEGYCDCPDCLLFFFRMTFSRYYSELSCLACKRFSSSPPFSPLFAGLFQCDCASSRSVSNCPSLPLSIQSSVRQRCLCQSSFNFRMILLVRMCLPRLLCDSDSCDSYSERKLVRRQGGLLLLCITPSNLMITLYIHTSFLLFQTNMTLTAAILAQHATSAFLFTHYAPHTKKGIADQAKMVASKAKFLKMRVAQREKVKGQLGTWYLLRSTETLLSAACVTVDYPERLAYALLQKLHTTVLDKPPRDDESEKKFKSITKELNAICLRYRDSCVDKVKQAQKAADELKMELNTGVKKLVGNRQVLDEMNDKASLMKDYAKNFQKSSAEVEQVTCWRKYKFFVIIGGFVVISLLSAGLIIYLDDH